MYIDIRIVIEYHLGFDYLRRKEIHPIKLSGSRYEVCENYLIPRQTILYAVWIMISPTVFDIFQSGDWTTAWMCPNRFCRTKRNIWKVLIHLLHKKCLSYDSTNNYIKIEACFNGKYLSITKICQWNKFSKLHKSCLIIDKQTP